MLTLTENRRKALWVAYFILGAAVPLVTWNFWASQSNGKRLKRQDEAQDSALEDSFPASDPPSSW
jgi:hypothetical protein